VVSGSGLDLSGNETAGSRTHPDPCSGQLTAGGYAAGDHEHRSKAMPRGYRGAWPCAEAGPCAAGPSRSVPKGAVPEVRGHKHPLDHLTRSPRPRTKRAGPHQPLVRRPERSFDVAAPALVEARRPTRPGVRGGWALARKMSSRSRRPRAAQPRSDHHLVQAAAVDPTLPVPSSSTMVARRDDSSHSPKARHRDRAQNEPAAGRR
jgi:hypothetical protein